jgi:uncharacterized protein (TIGR02271 family)
MTPKRTQRPSTGTGKEAMAAKNAPAANGRLPATRQRTAGKAAERSVAESATRSAESTVTVLRVPIAEERLVPAKRVTDQGELRIHKRVEEVEEHASLPVTRQEVVVERVAINRPIETPPEVRVEGDYLVVPVVAEELVVQRRLVLKEELRIHRRDVQETDEVSALLRREHVVLEDATVRGVRLADAPNSQPASRAAAAPAAAKRPAPKKARL